MRPSVRERYMALLSEVRAEPAGEARDEPSRGAEYAHAASPSSSGSGQMDAEDSARVVAGFRGLPRAFTPKLSFVRRAGTAQTCSYAWDEETGLVYMLD